MCITARLWQLPYEKSPYITANQSECKGVPSTMEAGQYYYSRPAPKCQVRKEIFMQENIITAIYRKYLNDAFEGIHAIDCDDLQIAYANLEKLEKEHNISLSEHIDIETDIINEITSVSELKGFTNGFKLAVRLIFEAYGTAK